MKDNQRPSKRQVRIFGSQNRNVWPQDFYILGDIDCCGAGRRTLVRIFRIGKKGDFAGLCLIKPGRAADFNVAIAEGALGASLSSQVKEFHPREFSPLLTMK